MNRTTVVFFGPLLVCAIKKNDVKTLAHAYTTPMCICICIYIYMFINNIIYICNIYVIYIYIYIIVIL